MVSERKCPNCQAVVSPQATFCRACKKSIPVTPASGGPPTRPSQPQAQGSATVLAPEARRSLVIQRLSFGAALSGLVFAILALPSALRGDMVMGIFGGGFAAAFLATAYFGRACHPIGRPLLIAYSVFLLIGFPVGTIQGVFQILHLSKPEAKLIFEGRDRFSAAEARQIAAFKTANAGLASWLRLVNFLAVIMIVGIVAAVAIPMLAR